MKKKAKQVKRSAISLTDKSKVKKQTKETQPRAAVTHQTGEPEMIQQVDIDLLIPTSDNTRAINEKSEGFKDLLASIEAEGVKIAVIARPHPDKPGKLDLRAGARRLR